MKRSRRSCVTVCSYAESPESPRKSKEVKKEKMLSYKEEMTSSSDESEIENQTPVKKTKGNDYLNMIEENRQKSLAFLKSLNMDEVKDNFCSSVKALKPERVKRQYKPKQVLPSRKSERLSKVNINLSEEALVQKVLQEAEHEIEKLHKTAKVFPDKFKFEECVMEKEDFSNFQEHFSDLDFKNPPKPIEFPDHFKRMKSKASLVRRVVPEKISSLTIHPSVNQVIITAGSKSGNLGFWNVTSNSSCMFNCHHQGITNVKYNTFDPYKLLTSSYDGRVLCGDMEKLTFEKYYEADDDICSCFDIVSSSTLIVGNYSGEVVIVDGRENRKCVKKHDCHNYRIKRVSVHPVDQNYFASSDTKGAIKVWDLRQLKEKPLCENSHHNRTVSSIFFSPATGKSILSTCWDHHCCIFDSSDLSKGLTVEKSIRHNNNTGRWLSPFQAVWVPNADEQFFAVGSLLYPRRIEVFNRNGSLAHEFFDENLNSVLTLLAFHSSLPVLAGGNSSGKVIVLQDL